MPRTVAPILALMVSPPWSARCCTPARLALVCGSVMVGICGWKCTSPSVVTRHARSHCSAVDALRAVACRPCCRHWSPCWPSQVLMVDIRPELPRCREDMLMGTWSVFGHGRPGRLGPSRKPSSLWQASACLEARDSAQAKDLHRDLACQLTG